MHIIFLGHETISHGQGLALNFNVDGIVYRRVSMLKTVNYFEKGRLLWWKRNDDEYLTEKENYDMEDMAETYFKTYKQDFNQLSLTANH